jgi:hypothetical protein
MFREKGMSGFQILGWISLRLATPTPLLSRSDGVRTSIVTAR